MADLPIGDIIEETWERFGASPGDFLILAFLATAAPLIANAAIMYPINPALIGAFQSSTGSGAAFGTAGALLQSSMTSFPGTGPAVPIPPLQVLLGGVVAMVVGTVLGALFGGAMVAEALDTPDRADPGRSLRTSLDHLVPLVVGGILIGLISLALVMPGAGLVLTGGISGSITMLGIGFLAMFVGFVFLIYLLVALYVWRAVIIDRDAGAVEALKESWDLTQGNRLALFLVLLVIGILTGIVASIIQLPFIFMASGASFGQTTRTGFSILRMVGTVIAGTVTAAFLPIASVRAYAHLSGRTEPGRDDEEHGPSPPEGYVPVDPGS